MRTRPALALALLAASCAMGCSGNMKAATRTQGQVATTAPSSCEASKELPPTLAGAARTGTDQQPVLVVGCTSR